MIKRLMNCRKGAALAEAALVLPFVALLLVYCGQIGVILIANQSMQEAAMSAARPLSEADFDDETNGTLTACSSISPVGGDGSRPVERIACDALGAFPGTYSVSATDGNSSGTGTEDAEVVVVVSVSKSSLHFLDMLSIMPSSGNYSATVRMRMQ